MNRTNVIIPTFKESESLEKYGTVIKQVKHVGIDGKDLSIIIPAYNEEARIEAVLFKYCSFFPHGNIVVVVDGCVDNTVAIVNKLCLKYPQLKLLSFKKRLGKGGGLIEGLRAANTDKIAFVDADESVMPEDLGKMIEALSIADGVIASRRLKRSKILVKQPWKRRVASRVFNMLVRVVFGLNYKDTQCGAKVFRKEAIKDVLEELTTRKFEFDVELLWRLKNKGYKVVEYPITWKHSEGTTFSLSKSPGMFFSLMKVRLWK